MFEHISKLKSGMVRRAIALILAVTAVTSLAACTNTGDGTLTVSMTTRTEDKDKINKFISDTLDYSFDEYTDEAEMDYNDLSRDSGLKVRILVKEDKAEDLKDYLKEKLGEGTEYTNDTVPRYQDHEFAVELKQMTPIRYYVTFKEGKVAKSIPINFYLAEDNGSTYLFIL